MKQFIIKTLTKRRRKLLVKIEQYNIDSFSDNLLIRIIDVIYFGYVLKQYFAVSQLIRKLQKQLILVAYSADCNDGSPEYLFTECLYRNKDKVSMVECREAEGVAFMLFYQAELGKCLDLFWGNKKIFTLAKNVADANIHKCECCDIGYFGQFPYTYRDWGGCIGRAYECFVCRQYTNVGRQNIIEYQREYGTEKAILKALTTGFTNKE